MNKIIGLFLGILISYSVTAFLVFDINIGEWGLFARVWFLGWAVVWGGSGLIAGDNRDRDIAYRKARAKSAAETIIHQ